MQIYRAELTLTAAAIVSQLAEEDAQRVLAGLTTPGGAMELRRLLRALYALPDEQRAAIVDRAEAIAGLQPDLRLRWAGLSG